MVSGGKRVDWSLDRVVVTKQSRKVCEEMYVIMRRIKIQPHLMEEARQRTEQFFLQSLSKEPGFLEFYSVQVGESEFVSISLFETKEEAEEGNRRALEWAREALFPLAEGPAEIVGVGAVLLHQKKEVEEER
jgi:heme-degrading monooxygenase HmoA